MVFKTQQEKFWAGKFGSEYIDRNKGDSLLAANLNFFCRALSQTRGINKCIEFGANIGMNLKALQLLFPSIKLNAIEINEDAATLLSELVARENIFVGSILDFCPADEYDLVLIKGVLIHMNPNELPVVYEKLINACKRYLLIAEYYNPSPVEISYRGHSDRLFKRDFAGEIMNAHPQMRLIDYGFSYHKDVNFPQDDITWFLLEKGI